MSLSVSDDTFATFLNGKEHHLAEVMGAHVQASGHTRFRAWAPHARAVSLVVGEDGANDRRVPMQLKRGGVWEVALERAPAGTRYRFAVAGSDGANTLKADPLAREAARRPSDCSVVADDRYEWEDDAWMAVRAETDLRRAPLSIYELHLGTWRREHPAAELSYDVLADCLVDYVADLKFTHVELMPITVHPYPGSWGYQTTGYFAPDPRHGSPAQLKGLIDRFHRAGIGVLLDWAPAHFAPDDWALARFDGGPTYEHSDPRRGNQPMWNTPVFDYSRPEVRSFLLSSALYWLTEFHIDGLRVDAVASMLRHDWGREPSNVLAEEDGSLGNRAAIGLLREMTAMVSAEAPGAVTIAEEATNWPGVTAPDGLGFTFAWNMGWSNDWLRFFGSSPDDRVAAHNDITFASSYAGAEDYLLPLSHDEVCEQSLTVQQWGDSDQRLAGLRALLALQWAHRGKKLLFMGCELGLLDAWTHHRALPWDEADRGVQALVTALNGSYRERPALWSLDDDDSGMQWVEADDREHSTYVFTRHGADGSALLCVANLGAAGLTGYRVAAGRGGWRPLLDTDDPRFGGDGRTVVVTGDDGLVLDLAPLSCLWLTPEGTRGA